MALPQLIALVDCNNFYVSCERVFRPDLIGKPVAVLSNNDGCVVARSQEVKDLGVKMGVPVFKIQQLVNQHQIQLFSSNYTLYGDMSHRVMTTLEEFTPRMEVYSIDEAFLDLTGIYQCTKDPIQYAFKIKKRVQKYTGIPVCVGMGSTKTLAKLANYAAKKWKKTGGVLDLSDKKCRDKLMAVVPVSEIWGVGRKISKKMNDIGIHTVLDLAKQPPEKIQQQFNIVVARTVMELNGFPCIELEDIAPDRQQIISSRSFGHKLTAFNELARALADYATRAAEKLRRQSSVTGHVSIFIHTNPFSDTDKQYQNSAGTKLILPTQDTRSIVDVAIRLLKEIFKGGFNYHKCGIVLSAIQSENTASQLDLFADKDSGVMGSSELMVAMDQVNRRFPKSLKIAASGVDDSWKAKSDIITKRYTTDWNELVVVR